MSTVYVAYVVGEAEEAFITDSPETARMAVEANIPDYFGKPFQQWREPTTNQRGEFCQFGTYSPDAGQRATVVIHEQKVLTADDFKDAM